MFFIRKLILITVDNNNVTNNNYNANITNKYLWQYDIQWHIALWHNDIYKY